MDLAQTIVTISGVLSGLLVIFKFETNRICKEIENLKKQVDEIHKKVFHK